MNLSKSPSILCLINFKNKRNFSNFFFLDTKCENTNLKMRQNVFQMFSNFFINFCFPTLLTRPFLFLCCCVSAFAVVFFWHHFISSSLSVTRLRSPEYFFFHSNLPDFFFLNQCKKNNISKTLHFYYSYFLTYLLFLFNHFTHKLFYCLPSLLLLYSSIHHPVNLVTKKYVIDFFWKQRFFFATPPTTATF